MGQRSQIYVRYNKGENIVAYHLQWNWGMYMINRAYQLLQFIEKNVEKEYSKFLSKNFDIANCGSQRDDYNILSNLIQINTTIGSYCKGHDLVAEEYDYNHLQNDYNFQLEPEKQDNNDGILVIDIQENEEGKPIIKYGFISGDDLYCEENLKIISAADYMEHYNDLEYMKEHCENENDMKEILEMQAEIYKQQTYIDENFKKLTFDEYRYIFLKKYDYKKNLINYKELTLKESPSF